MKNSFKNWLQSAPDNEWTNEDKYREAMQQIHTQSTVSELQEQAVPVGELIGELLALVPDMSGNENISGHHADGPEGPGYYYEGTICSRVDD